MKKSIAALSYAATLLFTLSSQVHAHRTYNVTGYTGSSDATFSIDGSDGLGLPAPTYSGGGGPNANNSNSGSYYNGALPVSWMTAFHAPANFAGENFTLSTAEALAIGATTPSNFQLAASGSTTGTGLDFGFLRVDNSQAGILITVSADSSLNSTLQPYLAVYSGWDHTWTGNYGTAKTTAGGSTASRNSALIDGSSNPFGSDLQYVFSNTNSEGLSSISYLLTNIPTASHLTLLIGGANSTSGNYTISMTTVSEVPVPAAAWLFGSALFGIGAIGRRRRM